MRIAPDSGCLEYRSRLAASRSVSGALVPGGQSWSVNSGLPYVSVPVLSKMMVRQVPICSSTAGSLMTIPRLAASEIEPMTATGMAISSGQGVAITSTARKRTASPLAIQAARATATATGVYTAPSWSPRRRSRGRRCSVARITFMIVA